MDVSSKKILVAEADEIVLVLIRHILTRQSYVVHGSATAAETEEMIATGNYDAVILAPRMPDTNGDFLTKLVDAHPALKRRLIVLAAGASDEQAFEQLGVQAVMRKPVEIEDLMQTVRDCLKGN